MLPGQQVFSIDIPDWDKPAGTITLHGSGQGGATMSDGSMPIHFTHDLANSGVRFTWEGNDAFSNDFISEGQMRCAGQPAQTTLPFEPNVRNYRLRRRYTTDGFEGNWDGDEASDRDFSPAYALEIIFSPPGNDGSASFDLGESGARVVERENTRPDGDIDVGQAFVQFFEMLGGTNLDPSAPSIGTVFVDGLPDQTGDGQPDCMVVLQTDSGEGAADQDARLHTFVREGADRDVAFTVCWD